MYLLASIVDRGRGAVLLQQAEQLEARDRGEPMTIERNGVAAMDDRQVVPAFEPADQVVHEPRVSALEECQRLVREDHTPSVGGIRPILLDDNDLIEWMRFLVEQRKIQTRGTAADAQNLHGPPCVALISTRLPFEWIAPSRTPA